MRKSGVRQVERGVELFGGHWRVGRIDDRIDIIHLLEQTLCVSFVGFLLDVSEILGMRLLVAKAFFVAVKHDIIALESARNVLLFG